MTVYAIGSTNDHLVRKLRSSDPRERAGAAEQLGFLHDYLALPHLRHARSRSGCQGYDMVMGGFARPSGRASFCLEGGVSVAGVSEHSQYLPKGSDLPGG